MFTLDAFDIFANPPLSLAFWLVIGVVLLYLARSPAHRTFRATARAIRNGLRLTSRSVMLAEQSLSQRNREVLFSDGAQAAEHDLDREFERIGKVVERDVSALPALHLQPHRHTR